MNNDPIKIVRLNIADLRELGILSIETFYESFIEANTEENMQHYMGNFFSEKKLSSEIMNADSAFYFAKINNDVVGYLKINFGKAQTELKDGRGLEIERIYVKHTFQGKRIGQLLFDHAMNIAREQHANYLWLGVWEKNPGAIRFYERNGLKQFSTHSFKLGDDLQTDIMMKIDIGGQKSE